MNRSVAVGYFSEDYAEEGFEPGFDEFNLDLEGFILFYEDFRESEKSDIADVDVKFFGVDECQLFGCVQPVPYTP